MAKQDASHLTSTPSSPSCPFSAKGPAAAQVKRTFALGWFRGRKDAIPQVLCEFKDIRSKLDAKQNRKGSTRTPVEQCLNYVRGARRGLFGNEPVQPWWGLVTDMNEFRLYWWDRAPAEYVRFVIRRDSDLFFRSGPILLTESDEARLDRYLFTKLFSRDMLLSDAGRPGGPACGAAVGARARPRRRVLRPLQGCARAPLQRPQAEQSGIFRAAPANCCD